MTVHVAQNADDRNNMPATTGTGIVLPSALNADQHQLVMAASMSDWSRKLFNDVIGPLAVLIPDREEQYMIQRILVALPHRDIPCGGNPAVRTSDDTSAAPSALWLICEARALLGKPAIDDRLRAALPSIFRPDFCRHFENALVQRPTVGERWQFLFGKSEEGKSAAAPTTATLERYAINGLVWEEYWRFDPNPEDGKVYLALTQFEARHGGFGRDRVQLFKKRGPHSIYLGPDIPFTAWIPDTAQ